MPSTEDLLRLRRGETGRFESLVLMGEIDHHERGLLLDGQLYASTQDAIRTVLGSMVAEPGVSEQLEALPEDEQAEALVALRFEAELRLGAVEHGTGWGGRPNRPAMQCLTEHLAKAKKRREKEERA